MSLTFNRRCGKIEVGGECMGNTTAEFITKEHFDNRLKSFESKIIKLISKEHARDEDDGPDPRPISRDFLKGEIKGLESKITASKNEMLVWMIGLLFLVIGFLYTILKEDIIENREIIKENRGIITENRGIIIENREMIKENKALIQKVLDNQNRISSK